MSEPRDTRSFWSRPWRRHSTTSAAVALPPVELIADELDTMRALLGLAPPTDDHEPVEVADGLTLCAEASGTPRWGRATPQRFRRAMRWITAPHVVVLRGPCELSLRATVDLIPSDNDGIALVRESGRSLRAG